MDFSVIKCAYYVIESVIVKIPVIQTFWEENASQYVENLSIGEKSEDVLSKSYFLIKQDNTLYEFYIIKKVFRI
jgi:hypothetical protein